MSSSIPEPQAVPMRMARAAQPKVVETPDYVVIAKKKEDAVVANVENNPIYKAAIDTNAPKEDRIKEAIAYLMAGLQDGTATTEDLDRRRESLTQFNAFIQVLRKQLGSEQAKEITNKAYADFQKILNDTTSDVSKFEQELAPLGQLAELFTKYGADGNLIVNMNKAKQQKIDRERLLAIWQTEHDARLASALLRVVNLNKQISDDKTTLDSKWLWSRATIEARVANNTTALAEAQAAADTVRTEEPDVGAPVAEVEPVDEGILQLQNIGGESFKARVSELREHTEEALARIASNFDEAVDGLTNTQTSFIAMDRNCSDANFALSILEVAVQEAEKQSRQIAESILKGDGQEVNPARPAELTKGMAELDRMEREQRSSTILAYTASLTTFLKDVGLAVASLRSGQAVIQNVLRMNALALESANTHKITGLANTADAVTIIIGSIIEVVNRAASRALQDGLTRIRSMAEQGAARLAGGTYETLSQQNAQLQEFVSSVEMLKETTKGITKNSVDLLRQQFELVGKMRDQSAQLAEATVDAQHTSFNARAGVMEEQQQKQAPTEERPRFGLRMPH